LFNVSGCVHPGELLALMGPSGSGKSSLLTVLGGRSTARTTGTITFNGAPLNKGSKRKLGFVSQDDLLFAELTVFETLYFAAVLRLPRSWSHDVKVSRVEMVLQGLGLNKCRDTIIGNHMMRGVSGGERKRVSIGHELLINPSVLFLDEPTSGLDSTTALKLLHTLRSLASGGRTIITSIHQPSSRLYQQMDKLMLLSEGHVMFYGDAHAAAHWFGEHGAPVPFGVSTADHLLDLACGDLPGKSGEESKRVMQQLVEEFRGRSIGLHEDGVQATDLGKAAVEAVAATLRDREESNAAAGMPSGPGASMRATKRGSEEGGEEVPGPSALALAAGEEADDGKRGASWLDQVRYLTIRSVRTRRFPALSIQRMIEVVVVAVLSGLFWWQLGGANMDERDALDVGGLLFFEMLFMSFSAMFQAIFNYPSEFSMLVKERQSGMYRLSAYYVARTLSDLPMDCLLPTLFVWIIYWMTGLRLSAGAFFANWWAMLLIILVAQSIGLLIGATVTNIKNCLAIATILMLGIMLVGGFYVRSIPVWISWLKYLSFCYWGWNLLLKIEFSHRGIDSSACGPNYPANQYCSVSQADTFMVDVDQSVLGEALWLIGFLLLVRLVTYMALKHKTTFKK